MGIFWQFSNLNHLATLEMTKIPPEPKMAKITRFHSVARFGHVFSRKLQILVFLTIFGKKRMYLNHLETLFPQFHRKHGKAVIFGWISNQDITSNFPKNLGKSKLWISNDEFPWKGVEFHIQLGKMHHLDAKGTKGELVLEFKMSQSFDCPHKSSMYVHCKQNCYF